MSDQVHLLGASRLFDAGGLLTQDGGSFGVRIGSLRWGREIAGVHRPGELPFSVGKSM